MFRHLLLAAAVALVALPVAAMDTAKKAGDVAVEQPWARASAGQAANGAAFVTLKNEGAQADRLVSVSTPVAAKAELHTHLMDGDVMKMRRVEAIDVPAGGMAELQPGGMHVMLMGLHAPLKEGSRFPLTLTFEHGGAVTVEVPVGGIGAMKAGHDHGSMKMKQ